MHLYIKKNIFVPFNTRCCRSHFDECGLIDRKEIQSIKSLKNSESRSKEQAVAIYLTWLKTGLPQSTSFFGVINRQKISLWC